MRIMDELCTVCDHMVPLGKGWTCEQHEMGKECYFISSCTAIPWGPRR